MCVISSSAREVPECFHVPSSLRAHMCAGSVSGDHFAICKDRPAVLMITGFIEWQTTSPHRATCHCLNRNGNLKKLLFDGWDNYDCSQEKEGLTIWLSYKTVRLSDLDNPEPWASVSWVWWTTLQSWHRCHCGAKTATFAQWRCQESSWGSWAECSSWGEWSD